MNKIKKSAVTRSLGWIFAALAVTAGCFACNIGGAWYGGPAGAGQLAATVLYLVFWGVFSVAAGKSRLPANVSFVISLLTVIAACNALLWRMLGSGGFISAFISVFASVPFYGLRILMDWTALYAVAAVISLIWLVYTGRNLRRLQQVK